MAIFNVANQLLQIDTGSVSTYLYNPTTGFAPWQGLGENQVLGQRYFGVGNVTNANPSGAPRIFMLVEYLSTSAITTANLTTAAAPAPQGQPAQAPFMPQPPQAQPNGGFVVQAGAAPSADIQNTLNSLFGAQK